MNDHTWIETKKECEVDDKGNLVPKFITLERAKKRYFGFEKKDAVDTLLRVASFFAVFIPLGLFYLQRKAEINKQKAIYQLQLYSEVTSQLHQILEMPVDSINFSTASNRLYYDFYPKLRILGEHEVVNKFREIKNQLPLYLFLFKIDDNFGNYSVNASHLLEVMLYIDDTHTGDEKKTIDRFFSGKQVIDSGYLSLVSMQQLLHENFIKKEQADTNGRNSILQFAHLESEEVTKIEQYQGWFTNIVNNFYTDSPINIYENTNDNNYNYTGFAVAPETVVTKLRLMKQENIKHKDLIRRYKNYLLTEVEKLDSMMMVSNSHL